MIRQALPADANEIARIYNHYVRSTVITFEEQEVTPSTMAERMADVGSATLPWLIADDGSGVVGYAYASRWKPRSAYRFAVETSVYVEHDHLGKGIGSALYRALFGALLDRGLHAVIGGIALPNEGSLALHEKFGMRKVAHFEQVGFKFGRWVDVGYWQRTLA
jgi:phosphinothricin acetyltransferase